MDIQDDISKKKKGCRSTRCDGRRVDVVPFHLFPIRPFGRCRERGLRGPGTLRTIARHRCGLVSRVRSASATTGLGSATSRGETAGSQSPASITARLRFAESAASRTRSRRTGTASEEGGGVGVGLGGGV